MNVSTSALTAAPHELPTRRPHPQGRPIVVEVLSRSTISRRGLRAVLREFPGRVRPTSAASGAADVILFELSSSPEADQRALGYLQHQAAAVIAIAHASRPDLMTRALASGAQACVTSEISAEALVASIRSMARVDDLDEPGEPRDPGDARLAAPLAAASPGPSRATGLPRSAGTSDTGSPLSDRETQVIDLIASGMSNHEIADALCLGDNTVKTYIRTAYRKIGVRTRTQAVLWAVGHAAPRPPSAA